MKRSYCYSAILTVIALILACAGTRQRGMTSFGEKRIIEASFDKLMKATSDYLLDRGFTITKTDYANGEIHTDYRLGVGWAALGQRGEKRARIEAKLIKIDENTTQLILEIFSEVRDPQSLSTWELVEGNTRDSRVFYDRFFEGITAMAQSRIRQ